MKLSKEAEQIVDFFTELGDEFYSEEPNHAVFVLDFYLNFYKPDELGPEWGYTREEALRGQLEMYAREKLGWTHPNEP